MVCMSKDKSQLSSYIFGRKEIMVLFLKDIPWCWLFPLSIQVPLMRPPIFCICWWNKTGGGFRVLESHSGNVTVWSQNLLWSCKHDIVKLHILPLSSLFVFIVTWLAYNFILLFSLKLPGCVVIWFKWRKTLS